MFWLWILAAIIFYNTIFKYLISLVRIKDANKKAILITGCDSGFGRDLALRSVRYGFYTYATCLTQQGIDSLNADSGNNPNLNAFLMDVQSDESIEEAHRLVKETLGTRKFHALVNNAGISGVLSPDAFCPIKIYQKVMDVNFFGFLRMIHTFSPLLKRDRGRIVNAASVNGLASIPLTAPYCASKCAVIGYSNTLRREMSLFGVKVIIIEPSFFRTPLTATEPLAKQIDQLYAECPQEEKQFYGPEYVEFLHKQLKHIDETFCSTRTYQVVDAYFDALTCVWPELRYHPGLYAKCLFFPLKFASTRVQDIVYNLFALLGPKEPQPLKLKST